MSAGELPDPLDHFRRRTADHIRRFGPCHFQGTTGLGLPAHIHANRLLELGHHHVLDEQAHHVFALGVRRGLRLPNRRQIVHQVDNALPLCLTDVARRRWRRLGVVPLELIQDAELLIPVPLQATGH